MIDDQADFFVVTHDDPVAGDRRHRRLGALGIAECPKVVVLAQDHDLPAVDSTHPTHGPLAMFTLGLRRRQETVDLVPTGFVETQSTQPGHLARVGGSGSWP